MWFGAGEAGLRRKYKAALTWFCLITVVQWLPRPIAMGEEGKHDCMPVCYKQLHCGPSIYKATKTVNHTIIIHNGDCGISVPVHYIVAGAAKAKCKCLRVFHFSIIQDPTILYAGSWAQWRQSQCPWKCIILASWKVTQSNRVNCYSYLNIENSI